MRNVLTNEDDLNARIYRFPTSAIKMGGQKVNYYDFLMSGEYADCNEAIVRIVPKIDMEQIEQFIDETPYISDLQKVFTRHISTLGTRRSCCPLLSKLPVNL